MADYSPLVSIIIPVFNSEKYIFECIQSVLNQSYPNKEIIVIDDGSSDNSRRIIESFGDRVVFIYQDNSGSAVARNKGIERSRGKYIAFNDSDDLWAPNRLQQQVDFLESNPEYGVATGRFMHVDANFSLAQSVPVDSSKQAELIRERSGWVYHTLFECSWYHIIAALVRADVLAKVSFNPEFRRGQDYDFWLQLAHHTRIAQLSSNYAYYRKNQNSISHRHHLRNYRAEIMENALSTMGSTSRSGNFVSDRELQRFFYNSWFEHGYELFLASMYKPAYKSFLKARRYRPSKFGSYKFIFRCLINMYRDQSQR